VGGKKRRRNAGGGKKARIKEVTSGGTKKQVRIHVNRGELKKSRGGDGLGREKVIRFVIKEGTGYEQKET